MRVLPPFCRRRCGRLMLPQVRHSALPAAWFPPRWLGRRPGRPERGPFTIDRHHGHSDRRRWTDRVTRSGAAVIVTVLAVACGNGAVTGTGGQAARDTASPSGPLSLRGVCPATIVAQSSWFPEAEHGVFYQLLGAGYRIDAKRKSVTGRLVASGADTGVQLEIRAGGPAIGYQQISAQMYADRSITIGMVGGDELIQQSRDAPVLGVLAPLELDPDAIMWDPKAHPDFRTISDIGRTDTRVPVR